MVSNPVDHTPALDVDPFATEVLLDPIACDTAVREAAPAVWLPRYGCWAVGRHEHVHAIFNDWQTYSSAAGTGLANNRKETPWRKPSVILEVDPPQHTRTRTVLSRILSPAAMARLRQDFQAKADALVDTLVERRRFDAATDLATAFPMQVLPDAVGLPQDGRENLLPYANLNFNAMGPKNALYECALAAAGDAPDWVLRQSRRENLKGDGFGARIFEAHDRGELDLEEAELLVRVFLTAALDTTIYGIGLALFAFASHPAQWDALREDASLTRAAFDEVLRFNAPSPFIGRTTTREVTLDGVSIGADEKIILFIAAANRDPRRWQRPDEFDVRRRPTGHLAFGVGIHGCVGQMVARLEAEVVFNALRQRVKTFELDGPPTLRPDQLAARFCKPAARGRAALKWAQVRRVRRGTGTMDGSQAFTDSTLSSMRRSRPKSSCRSASLKPSVSRRSRSSAIRTIWSCRRWPSAVSAIRRWPLPVSMWTRPFSSISRRLRLTTVLCMPTVSPIVPAVLRGQFDSTDRIRHSLMPMPYRRR